MSTITNFSNSINEAFPVPGQDNDSQGFRDNFNNTKLAFSEADIEISDLQNKVLLKQALGGTATVNNDLNNSTINNGSYTNFFGISNGGAEASGGVIPVNVDEASIHLFNLTNDADFTFKNWPVEGTYGLVRVQFVGPTGTNATPSLYTENGGDIVKNIGFPTNFALTLSKTASGSQLSGQPQVVLNNTTDLVVGMAVFGTNIPESPVTTITGIDSNTVTLSQNLTGTVSNGSTIRFTYPNGRVIEAWTINGGATVYVSHVGDF